MKYYEIIGHINTFFEMDDKCVNDIVNNKVVLEEKIKKSKKILEDVAKDRMKEEREPGIRRFPFRNSRVFDNENREFIQKINESLLEISNEHNSIIVESLKMREIRFLFKTVDDCDCEKLLKFNKAKIKKLIADNCNIILIDDKNNGWKEHYVSTDLTERESSLKTFYFDGMLSAQNSGLDVALFMDKINEKSLLDDMYRYDRVNHYLMEYDIPGKYTKEEFKAKYKKILLNKSFNEEIDRIYSSTNEYNVKLNPVHYEFTEYDLKNRNEMAKALATALYSTGRIKNSKFIKMDIDITNSYFSNEVVYLILKNSKESFVFIDFSIDRDRRRWDSDIYYARSSLRTNELTDNILALKDTVQFAFYVDKYQDRVRDKIYDELNTLNIVKFDNKLSPNKVMTYIKGLARQSNMKVTDKLISMVELSKNDMTMRDANDIFDNYKSEMIKNVYFPAYKEYFEGRGNVDNYIDPYDALMAMPGLKNVKKLVDDLITYNKINAYKKEHYIEYKNKKEVLASKYDGNVVSMNMIFMGNPGTCKTTVAKMIAKILKSRGIIKNDRTEEYGVDSKNRSLEVAFKQAYGGVLFIDEAYALGYQRITELVALMEDNRKDVIVILAGYTDSMRGFLQMNQGLKSRFKYQVEFEDYTPDELWEILKYQAKEKQYTFGEGVKEKVIPIFETAQVDEEMGNGRLCRNLLDMALMRQTTRFKDIDFEKEKMSLKELNSLTAEDFNINIKELTGRAPKKIIGNIDPEVELANMVGLGNIKSKIEKCIAFSEMNKIRNERISQDDSNVLVSSPMHLAFLGNPGTAKTTVARLMARILKKKGVIKRDDIVEVGRKDLVGQYVGHTAPKVKSVFEKARGGVLFIDEAYSLVDDRTGSYGDEAINTIIAEMENCRDEVIVIFAGYTDRMREFIARNEGLRSRLSAVMEFSDYSGDELYQIFNKMIVDAQLFVTEEARKYVRNIFSTLATTKDYGNGRYVRKMIENARLNMNFRLSKKLDKNYTNEELNTIVVEDFMNLDDDNILNAKEANAVGFAA